MNQVTYKLADHEIPKSPGVYLLKSRVNGKKYVGSSVNMYMRSRQHFKECVNEHYKNHVNKYGREDIDFIILEQLRHGKSKVLLGVEQYYIDALVTVNRDFNCKAIVNSALGVRWSEEAKRKRSEDQRGRKTLEKTKRRQSKARKEYLKNNPDVLEKIIKANRKRWEDAEYRERLREERKSKTVYDFWHFDHGTVSCIQSELREKYNLTSAKLSSVCVGLNLTHQGWCLLKNKDIIIQGKIHSFYHPDHGVIQCTQRQLCNNYGLGIYNVSRLCTGKCTSTSGGWTLNN